MYLLRKMQSVFPKIKLTANTILAPLENNLEKVLISKFSQKLEDVLKRSAATQTEKQQQSARLY